MKQGTLRRALWSYLGFFRLGVAGKAFGAAFRDCFSRTQCTHIKKTYTEKFKDTTHQLLDEGCKLETAFRSHVPAYVALPPQKEILSCLNAPAPSSPLFFRSFYLAQRISLGRASAQLGLLYGGSLHNLGCPTT